MDEMSPEAAKAFLAQAWLGHIGLAQQGRAYVIPIFYGVAQGVVYFQSLPGAKDAYMAATKEACLSVTHAASADAWTNVEVFGPLEEVQLAQEQLVAMEALMRAPLPPAPGHAKSGTPRRSGAGLHYWKLTPTRITGRTSMPAPVA